MISVGVQTQPHKSACIKGVIQRSPEEVGGGGRGE